MRTLICAGLAGAMIAGVAGIGSAEAQRYYDPRYDRPAYGYDPYYGYRAPAPYGYGPQSGTASALSVLGSVLGLNYGSSFYSGVPVDRYGPDPNGMIGPDGRRIKCKLRRSYDRYYGSTITRRECWTRR